MQNKRTAYLQMHITTFLWGLTAILGKLISISELPLVWYRVLIVSVVMLFIPKIIENIKTLSFKKITTIGGIGIILTLHWVAWYGAVKFANASVAVSCIALISFFISVLEPIITKNAFNKSNLFFGIIVIPGILLINQSLDINLKFGFWLGILAAILAAFFSIYNKKYTQEIEPNSITFIQMLSGFLFLSFCLPFYLHFTKQLFPIPTSKDFILLMILSVVCTIIPYNLFLRALKATNAFTTSLINNLEPVYGVILAAIFLHENEQLNWKFYIGSVIIVSAVFLHAMFDRKKSN
ncbi:MAG: DMT family transporter [Saprospirales bacterium]|nr:DMT family transporter [Saprospirales bacterium]